MIFIGPEQLPEVARTLARLFNEWKRTTSDIQYYCNPVKRICQSRAAPPSSPR